MKNLSYYILTLLLVLATGWKQPTQEPIYENTAQRTFSDPQLQDDLSIKLFGSSILSGTIVISITSHDGRTIFSEEYPSSYLLGYSYTGDRNNKTQKEEHIKKRIDEFYKEENFSAPAIPVDEEFDEDYSKLELWNDIKSDQTAVGFYYLIGEESGCRIAYSKKQRKTITYFCCC